MLGLDLWMTILLIFCILAACSFEFINGFHDTANAVATVIYTNSLKPVPAVIWSGIVNFLGVMFGGIAVAMAIVHLLPISVLVDQSTTHSISMILSLLFSAIIWNIGTWYFGIPVSSSHTLLGSIFGIGIAYGLLPGTGVVSLNWEKVVEVITALFVSPLIGFTFTMAVVFMARRYIKYKKLFNEPEKKKKPPFWIRLFLILTSTGLSFTHGQNDGQKGVGLMMIILITIVPARFAMDHTKHPNILLQQINNVEIALKSIDSTSLSIQSHANISIINQRLDNMQSILADKTNFKDLKDRNKELRDDIYIIAKEVDILMSPQVGEPVIKITSDNKNLLKNSVKEMNTYTDYAPWWVILMISFSLGLGTMIGWKRIVVTIGEKIGKEQMNYAQGASANLVTAGTIGISSIFGLPVSTTHILSSGVAGSMVATKGVKNLKMRTIKNILIAWLVTLPVTIILSGGLFLLFRLLFQS